MADPLSIAGSAVGIVSLGLTVTQGLISYYGPWRAYDQEIGELAQKAEGLKATLRIVQSTLQGFEPTWILQLNDVQSNVNSCREVLQKLEKAMEKYRKVEPPSDFGERLQSTGKRALYPFRRKTLIWLKASVEGVQMNLNTTLQTLQLALSAYHKQKTEQLVSISTATSNVVDRIYKRMDQLENGFSTICTTIQDETKRAVSGINSSRQNLQDMNSAMTKLQEKLIREPVLLRTLCNQHLQINNDQLSQLHNPGSRIHRQSLIPRILCSCSRRLYTKKIFRQLSRASIFQVSAKSHEDGCPFIKIAETKRTFGLYYLLSIYVLRFSIQATLSMAAGAGRLSFEPRVILRNVVPDDAPGFRLLADLSAVFLEIKRPISENFVSEILDSTLQQLYTLFNTRRASPTDVTLSGQTLLHYVSHIFRAIILVQSNAAQSCRRFLKGIIDAGADINDMGNTDRTPIDYLIYYVANYGEQVEIYTKAMADICTDLINYGAVVSENAIIQPGNSFNPLKIIEIVMRHENEYPTALDMPDIVIAIITRSEKLLDKTISKYPASVNTRLDNNMTPLHLSVGWPQGVLLLLNAGARVNATDVFNQLPIYYACLHRCVSSMLFLLDAGSAIFTLSNFQSTSILDCAIQSRESELLRVIIRAMAKRRQQLQILAESTLPDSVLCRLNLTHDQLLDSRAFDVWNTLSDYGIQACHSLNPGPCSSSVYHVRYLNLRTARELFDIGFHDVASFNWIGTTPLTQLGGGFNYVRRGLNDSLALGRWLISNGADIHQEIEGISDSYRMGHDLGDYVGAGLWDLQHYQSVSSEIVRSVSHKLFSTLDIQSWDLLFEIFEATESGCCLCACSSRGCRPLTKTLKVYEEDVRYVSQRSFAISEKELRLSFIQGFIECMMVYLESSSAIPSEIIRFLTFIELDLTHTCCFMDGFYKKCLPVDEVEEIRAEQRKTIDDLEELVNMFEAQRKGLGLPLDIFLSEYWSPRMDEYLTQELVLDERVVSEARELGVILELY